jgi:trehalose-6-phosphate synthase
MLVPRLLRNRRPELRIGFFLHVPFPPMEVFRALPRGNEILAGLLGADLIGFHLPEYRDAFAKSVQRVLGGGPHRCQGIHVNGGPHCAALGSFPIGIDVAHWERIAASPETEAEVRKVRAALRADREQRVVALAVDRLDYTKGILERLAAIERFLAGHSSWRRRFVFVQVAVPSRTSVDEYRRMKVAVEQAVGRLNGAFGEAGWTPIRYLYRSLDQATLAAYYRSADLALITPLRDGMNLVAKEYVATRLDDGGRLVLSDLAGAASELRGAFRVNPYDPDGVADTIGEVLATDPPELARRMAGMRATVRAHDVQRWWRTFLGDLVQPRHSLLSGATRGTWSHRRRGASPR